MKNRGLKSEARRLQSLATARRRRGIWLALVLLALSLIALTVEQQSSAALLKKAEPGAVELYQSLLDLQSPWTVMCVAAHPDDEDGATLTVLRRKHGVHTVTVFSTYGEGGQNATGPELYEELGAIRARETIKASEIQGSEAYFLGLRDFGFSKSAEEAFRIWGQTEALRRMVLKVRELRPDVIITNHDTQGGHGHHQATGRLILEAFDAAADPNRFPEQLRGGLSVWQAQRLFVRVGAPGGTATSASEAQRDSAIVSVNRNERDAVRGQTYAELALSALQQHATQGPWPQTVPANWAANAIRYRLVRSATGAALFPPNAQTFLDGLVLPQGLTHALTQQFSQTLLSPDAAKARRNILTALVAAQKNGLLSAPPRANGEPRSQLMRQRLNRALGVASQINATLAPESDVLIPGTTAKVTLKISNDGESDARILGINLGGLQAAKRLRYPLALARGQSVNVELQSFTTRTTGISVPHAEHLYDGNLFGKELAASVNIELDGATFPVEAVRRVDVAPAVEIASITPTVFALTPGTISTGSGSSEPGTTFHLRLINHQDKPFKGKLVFGEGLERDARLQGQEITLAAHESREVRYNDGFILSGAAVARRPGANSLAFSVFGAGASTPLTQRSVKVVWSDARVAPNVRVGYVRSFDDTLRDSLAALGGEAKALTIDDVRTGDLQDFQAIIIDNRGYQAHPEMVAANSRLLDYVRQGGTLIVFYHRTNEWNPDPERKRPQLAPYPITLGNSRVTDETAPVVFSEPDHPLLNYPNKITQRDFADWIQERGLYYPQSWDKQYSAPLAMSDAGEAPLRGGLLAADYGRGRYIYTSMVWYRQLRAGVSGAYRVLANMISYGR